MTSSIQSRLGNAPEEGCKAPVKVVTTAPITLSGEQTISTVAVVAGDRVLVAGQADSAENGIYNVSTTAWSRSTDFNKSNDVIAGMLIPVTHTESLYIIQTFSGDFVAGTTEINFRDGFLYSRAEEAQLGSAASGQVFTLASMIYKPGTNNLAVHQNGQRVFDFTETSSTVVTIGSSITINPNDTWVFGANEATTNNVTTTQAVSHTVAGTVYNLSQFLLGRNTLSLITDGDASPAVPYYEMYKTSNTTATTITTFDNVEVTKKIWVIFGDSNTTVDFTGTNLKGNAGVDWEPNPNDHMTCVFDGINWYCDISDNTA